MATRLPADLDLNRLALMTNAIQRIRPDGIGDGETLLRLALARGPGGKTLKDTAAWARLNGVVELCEQSLNERLHGCTAFLAAIVHRLLTGRRASPSSDTPSSDTPASVWAGRSLRIADGSSLSEPGSRGTDWRLHAVYDLSRGGFSHVQITDRRGAESLLRAAPVAGEVLIADRGYAKAKELRACLDPHGGQARAFIVRAGWKALALRDAQGNPFDLIGFMQRCPAGAGPQEVAVQAVIDQRQQPVHVPLRLIVLALPADKAEANRKRLKRTASKHQDKLDPRSLVAAGFVVLVSSLPHTIPPEEIYRAYRLRWQIELAFKRLKSLIRIDRLPTRSTAGGLSWLYAHLILLLLTEDIVQDFLDASP